MFKILTKITDFLSPYNNLHIGFDSGGKNKPVIVLLHGIAATSKSWDFLLKELDTEKYRVIAIDLLGFGKSPKPKHQMYDVYDHIKNINHTLSKLSISRRFTLVGHSMGSIIAVNYAINYPNKVKNLFLLSLPLYTKSDKSSKSIIARKKTDIYLNAYNLLVQKKNTTIKYSKRIRTLLNLNDGADINEENWNSFRRSLQNTIINQNTINEISRVKVPIRVIYGSLDGLLVEENIKILNKQKNIHIKKITGVHHLINKKFASVVADQIIASIK